MNGTLPTEMSNLSSLTRLDIAYLGDLRGSLPSQFINLSNLSEFNSIHCFNDEISFTSFLSSLPTSLKRLEIFYANIQGTIPSEIALFQRLTDLSLWGLLLTGTLPSEIGLMTELQSLRFSEMLQYVGDIPSEILYSVENTFTDRANPFVWARCNFELYLGLRC
jgi:hypothetical protein